MNRPPNPKTSHDPRTDHRSLCIVLGMSVLTVIAVCGAAGMFDNMSKLHTATPYAVIDGCTVYRFDDEKGANYFAKCGNGKVSTTSADGKKYITTTSTP